MKSLLFAIIGLVGIAAVAIGHESHGYVHVTGPFMVVKVNPQDDRCPMVPCWTLVDGSEVCVVFAHDKLHFKYLKGE